MNKKITAVSIIAMFVFILFVPTNVAAESNNNKSTGSNLTSVVSIYCEDIGQIVPNSGAHEFPINVTYELVEGGFFSKLISSFLMGKQVSIKLEIVDMPSWCQASLLDSILTTVVSDTNKTQLTAKISIAIDANAPAYGGGYVKINAAVDPIKGPLGVITFVQGFNKQVTIPFEPAYLPLIKIETSSNFFEIAPFNETKIPITITNLGNAKTKVFAEIVNHSENWNVSISDVVLDVDGDAKTYLQIIADNKFEEEIIKLKFTPARAEDLTETGAAQFVTIAIKNDGSYKEPEPEEWIKIDTTLLLVVLIAILLLIIIVLVIKRKK